MFSALLQFLRDRRGGVGISFVAFLPIMLSGMALAVDYSNYRLAQTRMQTAADAGALAGVGRLGGSSATPVSKAVASSWEHLRHPHLHLRSIGDCCEAAQAEPNIHLSI